MAGENIGTLASQHTWSINGFERTPSKQSMKSQLGAIAVVVHDIYIKGADEPLRGVRSMGLVIFVDRLNSR